MLDFLKNLGLALWITISSIFISSSFPAPISIVKEIPNEFISSNLIPTIPPSTENIGVIPCKDDMSKGLDFRIKECPITGKERANFKGKEIAKIGKVAKQKVQDYFIEITEIKAIEGGVELLARAWNLDGSQIGFGKYGSVDLERFIIINPPILVDDPNGTIVRQWLDETTGQLKQRKLREAPKEAILQSLASTIDVKQQKFGSENIIAGKIGNTTLTAYPQPSTGTAPIDGHMVRDIGPDDDIFSTLANGAGTSHNDTNGTFFGTYVETRSTSNEFSAIYRGGVGFDTSSIGTNNIDSAILSLYTTSTSTLLGSTDQDIVAFTPANGADFATTDFAIANWGSTRFATGKDIATGLLAAAYTDFTLNANGIANINKTGNTFFGLRSKWDVDLSFTGSWGTDLNTSAVHFSADAAGTTQDPKLVVEHSVAATPVNEEYIILFE